MLHVYDVRYHDDTMEERRRDLLTDAAGGVRLTSRTETPRPLFFPAGGCPPVSYIRTDRIRGHRFKVINKVNRYSKYY